MKKSSLFLFLPLFAVLLFVGASCASTEPADDSNDMVVQQPQQQQEEISPEEQEFLDSGRAKAYADETDAWPLFIDDKVGVQVSYPLDIDFDSDESGAAYRLDVDIQPIAGLEGTMGYNEETAWANLTALGNGEYGEGVDFSLADSQRVRDIGGTNAQDFLVLGRFEVCDVTFERKLYFLHNDHQVVLTLSADKEFMLPPLAEYFETDAANCGDELAWIFDRQTDFYDLLLEGAAPPSAQGWYDLFDQIVGTIVLTDGETVALEGVWYSSEDEKSMIEFRAGQKMDYYDNVLMSEGDYQFDGVLLSVRDELETYEYSVVELTDSKLVLTYLARGNTLEYTR